MRSSWGIAALVLCAAACSTPKKRIEENQALFSTYSPEDQAAIRSGQIRQGFDQTQVYMALGKPTKKKTEGANEEWLWLQRVKRQVTVKKDVNKYALERNEYEQGRRLKPPSTEEVSTQHRTRIVRVVKFVNGKVVSREDPPAMFADEWH